MMSQFTASRELILSALLDVAVMSSGSTWNITRRCSSRTSRTCTSGTTNILKGSWLELRASIIINFSVEWYKQKIPAVKPWQISVDYTSEYLIKPEVPQRMIDELPNNQTRIIMMVCDPIERAELEFFEIFNNLDTNHADWKEKIDAVGDIVSKLQLSLFS